MMTYVGSNTIDVHVSRPVNSQVGRRVSLRQTGQLSALSLLLSHSGKTVDPRWNWINNTANIVCVCV